MNVYIYSPSYNENSGGIIALHRLCHIINTHSAHNAYLIPFRKISENKSIKTWIKEKSRIHFPNMIIHPLWKTPIYKKKTIGTKDIIIYPEIIDDNPIGAKNVVRWLLHQPGYFTHKIAYSSNELYFRFHSAINAFDTKDSKISDNLLKVLYFPTDIYTDCSLTEKDIDVCYLVRKGNYKDICHDEKAVCIDGLSHKDTAEVFKRSKRFICYDDYTAYSIFAILCGCESIVVPDNKTSLEEWNPNVEDRYGIAYGFSDEQLDWANKTKNLVKDHIDRELQLSVDRVLVCLEEMKQYFAI